MSYPESYSFPTDGDALPPSDAARRLALAIDKHPGSGGSTTELRDAACDYVRELKEQSLPPERVLIQVKSLLGMLPERHDTELGDERLLLRKVITWCIEAYYAVD